MIRRCLLVSTLLLDVVEFVEGDDLQYAEEDNLRHHDAHLGVMTVKHQSSLALHLSWAAPHTSGSRQLKALILLN